MACPFKKELMSDSRFIPWGWCTFGVKVQAVCLLWTVLEELLLKY